MADAEVTIRRYAAADAAAVRDLFVRVNRALAPPGMAEAFEAYITLSLAQEIDHIPQYYGRPGCGFWIAQDAGGDLLGMFGLEPAGSGAVELRRMYVAPEARRRGIARAMLQRAEQECRALGYATLVLSTASIQTAALALYRGAGYRQVRVETADAASNKTVGGGMTRFHFEKMLRPHVVSLG
ncbi:MAG: GNAT family N-acetyltransferase [Proteobacteria bacterium]|nr:GNAT family N-acetyltransferase [Pseudomonadota bacterium]